MDLHISLDGRGDLTLRLYQQIRAAIGEGVLRPGEALPSTRELARQLAVARSTVAVAYDRLVAEGFLRTRIGSGTYVGDDAARSPGSSAATSPLRPRPVWDLIGEPPDMSEVSAEFDFRTGIPDLSRFPYPTWRALVAEQLHPAAVRNGAHIGAAGHPELRAAIARHIGVSRAVRATADDVVVTSGSQQAVDVIARVMLGPGDVVAVEDPGYPPPQKAFTASGCRVVGVPVDAEGLVVAALPAAARLVYTCPSHQFPLGMVMSLRRRRELLEWADRADATIIEDDYDSEFRYGGRPLEPLQRLDHTGRVLYVGSMSKVLLPTLRLGFLVAPAPLHAALRKAKHVADWHTAVPMQVAAARFIDQGHLARYVRLMRGVYTARHQAIRAALSGPLAPYLDAIPSAAGLHVAATFRGPGADAAGLDDTVVRDAATAGVAVQALSRFRLPGSTTSVSGLMLGYGAIDTADIPEGLRRLAGCLQDCL